MKTVRLGQIAESLPCDYGDEPNGDGPTFDVVKVSNVSADGELYGEFEKRQFRDNQVDSLLVKEGELLVVKSSGSKANILSGKTAICGRERAGRIVASNFLLRLRIDESVAVPRFIWYVLNSAGSKGFVKTIVGASTYPNLKWSLYASHPIALPPLAEQRRIAAILDKADALRLKRRAALAQLDALTESIFLAMFGDPATNPKGWPKVRVGEVSQQIRGVTYAKEDASLEQRPGYLPILRAGNISSVGILLDDLVFVPEGRVSNVQRLRGNDVLIAASSGSLDVVGKAARVEADLNAGFGAFCKVLRPYDAIDPMYFAAFFLTRHYRQRVSELAAGININNLRSEHLDDFPMPMPPLELQRVFASRLAKTERVRRTHRASLTDLDALLASLQYRAFRGEL